MKKHNCVILYFLFVTCFFGSVTEDCYALEKNKPSIRDYSMYAQCGKTFTKNSDSEYGLTLYGESQGLYSLGVYGKVHRDYDSFGNEIKVNVFTVLGLQF